MGVALLTNCRSNSIVKSSTVVLAGALGVGLCQAQTWVHVTGTGLLTTSKNFTPIEQPYTGIGSKVTQQYGFWRTYFQVTGSTATPPWPTWLTPLTTGPLFEDVSVSVPASYVGQDIPIGQSYKLRVEYVQETGYDQWYASSPPLGFVARRDRKWDTSVTWRSFFE
jgi:hypothetical protein